VTKDGLRWSNLLLANSVMTAVRKLTRPAIPTCHIQTSTLSTAKHFAVDCELLPASSSQSNSLPYSADQEFIARLCTGSLRQRHGTSFAWLRSTHNNFTQPYQHRRISISQSTRRYQNRGLPALQQSRRDTPDDLAQEAKSALVQLAPVNAASRPTV